jgi:hypothetical protein
LKWLIFKGSPAGYGYSGEVVASDSKCSKSNTSDEPISSTCNNLDFGTSDYANANTVGKGTISTSIIVDASNFRNLVLRASTTSSSLIFDRILPGELRNQIYEHLLADIPLDFQVKEDRLRLTEWSTNRFDTSKQPYLQRLCLLPFISPLVFVECTSMFLWRSTFYLTSLDDIFHLETFLLTMPKVHSFDRVREIFLVDYDTQASTRSRADAIMGFCARLTNLERLHIQIDAQSLLDPTSYHTIDGVFYCQAEPRLRDLSLVVDDLEFRKVARMPLKAVSIVINFKWLWWRIPHTVAMDIGYWLVNLVFEQQPDVNYVNTGHFVDPSRHVSEFELNLLRE